MCSHRVWLCSRCCATFFFPVVFSAFYIWSFKALKPVLCDRDCLRWPSLPLLTKPSFFISFLSTNVYPTTDSAHLWPSLPPSRVPSPNYVPPHPFAAHSHPCMPTMGMYGHPWPSPALHVTFCPFWCVLHSALACVFDVFFCVFLGCFPFILVLTLTLKPILMLLCICWLFIVFVR